MLNSGNYSIHSLINLVLCLTKTKCVHELFIVKWEMFPSSSTPSHQMFPSVVVQFDKVDIQYYISTDILLLSTLPQEMTFLLCYMSYLEVVRFNFPQTLATSRHIYFVTDHLVQDFFDFLSQNFLVLHMVYKVIVQINS